MFLLFGLYEQHSNYSLRKLILIQKHSGGETFIVKSFLPSKQSYSTTLQINIVKLLLSFVSKIKMMPIFSFIDHLDFQICLSKN